MSLLWTLGVYFCSRHQKGSNSRGALKNMINPTTVALTVAFVIMLLKIPMPDLLMDTIAGIGGTSKYLTLIYIGGAMAFVSVKNVIKKPSILLFPIVKMLMIPILVYLISGFFLKQIDRSILTLIAGLPSMTTIAMVAAAYKSDDEYATEIIFVTTIASLLTIPAVSIITSLMK
jgi:predicted permease